MNQNTINKLNYNTIKKVIQSKGYPFIEDKYLLHHVGIRSDESDMVINKFDDYMCYLWIDDEAEKIIIASCTTIPGLWFLDSNLAKQFGTYKELNTKGTGILVPGYYPNVWKLDQLWGFPAWVQVGYIKCYRQKLLDGKLHLDPATIETGNYEGMDNHGTNNKCGMIDVNNWSAMCQAVNDVDKFNQAILVGRQQLKLTNYKLNDYILLEEKEFFNI